MCYKKFDQPKRFLDAEGHCKDKGGHLARICSKEERDLVHTLGGEDQFWIGLWSGSENSCHPDKNSYVWTDGTTGTCFDGWDGYGGQPDCFNAKEGQAAFFNFKKGSKLWHDTSMLDFRTFVCGIPIMGEYNLNYIEVTT